MIRQVPRRTAPRELKAGRQREEGTGRLALLLNMLTFVNLKRMTESTGRRRGLPMYVQQLDGNVKKKKKKKRKEENRERVNV
jgi:hypothetical protein